MQRVDDVCRTLSRCTSVLLAMTCLSCAKHNVAVEFYFADGYHFSQPERRAIQTVADATAIEVRSLLPALPHDNIGNGSCFGFGYISTFVKR